MWGTSPSTGLTEEHLVLYSSQARIIRKQGLKIYMVKPLQLSERPYKLKTE